MRFKADENLPAEVATVLANAGHDVATVLAEKLGGYADPKLVAACKTEGRALITLDTDFANIRRYPPLEHSGLVVLRLTRQDRRHVLTVLTRLLEKFDSEPLSQRLWIVEEHRVRIRPGDQQ